MKKWLLRATVALPLATACALVFAQQVTDEQRSAIKSACRGDYSSVCSGVPTGGMPALQCLQQHSQQVSSGCQKALSAVSPSASASTPPAATAPSATPAAPAAVAPAAATAGSAPARAASPREEARVLRSECGADFQKLCASVAVGGGRGAACLRAHASELSPRCSSALSSMAPK